LVAVVFKTMRVWAVTADSTRDVSVMSVTALTEATAVQPPPDTGRIPRAPKMGRQILARLAGTVCVYGRLYRHEGADMYRSTLTRVLWPSLTAVLLIVTAAAANGSQHREVDESQLVPALSPTFEPWDCKLKKDGPVCTGERHLDSGWEPLDIPCETPLWIRSIEHRYQARFYDHDHLNYHRKSRTNDIEYLNTAPTGSPTASLRTNARWTQTFDVRGDDQTMTQVTNGVHWDLRSAQGHALFRVAGTLVEPYDGPATFSGMVTVAGVPTRYEDEPLDEILDEEEFLANLCSAAAARP
jgi:hypothetical protein